MSPARWLVAACGLGCWYLALHATLLAMRQVDLPGLVFVGLLAWLLLSSGLWLIVAAARGRAI